MISTRTLVGGALTTAVMLLPVSAYAGVGVWTKVNGTKTVDTHYQVPPETTRIINFNGANNGSDLIIMGSTTAITTTNWDAVCRLNSFSGNYENNMVGCVIPANNWYFVNSAATISVFMGPWNELDIVNQDASLATRQQTASFAVTSAIWLFLASMVGMIWVIRKQH